MILKMAKRIVILVVGLTVVLIGIVMLVAPGPAIVVIPAGLAILATEFAWARHWLRIMRESAEKGVDTLNMRPLYTKIVSFFSRKDSRQSTAGSRQ